MTSEMKWDKHDYVIQMIWLWTPLVVNVTKVNSTKVNDVKYQVMNDNSLTDTLVTLPPQSSNEHEALPIHVLSKSTSSIIIEWKIQGNVYENMTILGSKVEYFLKAGRFSSHILLPYVNSFKCEHLHAATEYTICVYVYLSESVYMNDSESIDLSKCIIADTIPYIRSDSMLVLCLALGYYTLMGLIGFWQWKRKFYIIQSRNRRVDVDANGDNKVNSTMRYSELEERQRLTNPTCSIEDSHNNVL